MPEPYRPRDYWSERLADDFSLRGTGHYSYSESYNRWLYRAKGRALRRALRPVRAGSRVLDVGSGVGWVVEFLTRRGLEVDGCDIAPVAVERLQARFPGVTFFAADIGSAALPRGDASYDAVTALDVLYHVFDDAAFAAALGELARVLRPGGRLIVTDGFAEDDAMPAGHVRFRSLDRWRRHASEAGLAIDETLPLYRWLSRPPEPSRLHRLPDGARGAVEYGLELVAPCPPHMRCAVLVRQ